MSTLDQLPDCHPGRLLTPPIDENLKLWFATRSDPEKPTAWVEQSCGVMTAGKDVVEVVHVERNFMPVDDHTGDESMGWKHVTNSERKELKEGADFEELAKEKSDDQASRDQGGDLELIYKGILDPAFDEAVSKLKPGEISEKVTTRFGFHVIQLIEKHPPEQVPFDTMENSIQKFLFMEEAKKQVEVYIEGLRKQATIETFF